MGLVQTKGTVNFFPLALMRFDDDGLLFCFVNYCGSRRLDADYTFPSLDCQLGANAILAVSLAVCKAGAMVHKIPLYKVYVLLVWTISIHFKLLRVSYMVSAVPSITGSTLPILLGTNT